jgi:uncharacterized protein
VRFFDASAIVKRYVDEAGSARVRTLLAHGDAIVSRLTEVEVGSSINRRTREGALSAGQRDRILDAFTGDMTAWQIVEITPEVTSTALGLMKSHPLRAADAVQLASALVVAENLGGALAEFVAFDERLLDAARRVRLTVAGV